MNYMNRNYRLNKVMFMIALALFIFTYRGTLNWIVFESRQYVTLGIIVTVGVLLYIVPMIFAEKIKSSILALVVIAVITFVGYNVSCYLMNAATGNFNTQMLFKKVKIAEDTTRNITINTYGETVQEESVNQEVIAILNRQPDVLFINVKEISICDNESRRTIFNYDETIAGMANGDQIYLFEGGIDDTTVTHELAHTYANKKSIDSENLNKLLYKYQSNETLSQYIEASNAFTNTSEFFAEMSVLYFYHPDELNAIAPDIYAQISQEYA